MKAILVIDMPTDCIKCPLADGYCWNTFPTKGKADGCPLRPLPEEKKVNPHKISLHEIDYAIGWNDCLDEITDHIGESTEKVCNDDLYESWMFFDEGETE